MKAYVQGAGVLAPGLESFHAAREILAGSRPYALAQMTAPAPEILPAVERRRAAESVRYALSAAQEALAMSGISAHDTASVFASSGGDGNTLHQICEALAGPEHAVSPTRFHNSVHNAAAGYWSIATGCRAASASLCAYDASFAAGLLDAMSQVELEKQKVLLAAFDCPYPQPLYALRPLPWSFAAAFVLTPRPTSATLACWEAALCEGSAAQPSGFPEEITCNPAARALPLLIALAKKAAVEARLEYLPGWHVIVKCRY